MDRATLAKIDLSTIKIDPEVVRMAAGKYFRHIPQQFQIFPKRREEDAWELALSTGQWRSWADDHEYKTTADVPELVKHLLDKSVDFQAFKDFWIESHIPVCLINLDLDFVNTSKTWADHIAGYVNHLNIFKIKKTK
jgi:hypothetical protein